ncbi:hypothetical protein [Streptomyces sp. 4N124]
MREILIVGGAYAGFYTAWGLEKKLRPGEAQGPAVGLTGEETAA